MPKAGESTRVVKRLNPTQPGAIKLARRYGEALVCVRYRHDADGHHRLTTVELVVERVPIVRRPSPIVAVKLPLDEPTLRIRAMTLGAKWDGKARVWYMSRAVAKELGVLKRIVQD
jgi:hypothetical protein